jgi:colanic acid biosynthesis glycosyl transferase WcaI
VRILLINQFYPPDTAATGQLLADVAQYLAAQDYDVHVICSKGSYAGGDLREKDSSIRNLTVHRVHASKWGRGNLAGRIVDYLSFYVSAFLKVQTMPHMDVCLALTTPPFIGLIASFMKRKRGTRFLLWTMDLYPEIAVALSVLKKDSLLHNITKRISAKLYKRADAIISLGEIMSKRLLEAGADQNKILTVHNWVPGEVIKPPKDESFNKFKSEHGLTDKLVYMYSGNLGMGHELEIIFEALMHMDAPGDNIPIRMVFVGKGKMRASLERLAANLNIDWVDFVDPVPLNELSDTIAAGDVHIVSQKPGTEGLIVPSKIYGILAAGRPSIFIGPPECEVANILKESGSGIQVEHDDISALAEALQDLSDPSKRKGMGNKARLYYENNLGHNIGVRSITKLITSNAEPNR